MLVASADLKNRLDWREGGPLRRAPGAERRDRRRALKEPFMGSAEPPEQSRTFERVRCDADAVSATDAPSHAAV